MNVHEDPLTKIMSFECALRLVWKCGSMKVLVDVRDWMRKCEDGTPVSISQPLKSFVWRVVPTHVIPFR